MFGCLKDRAFNYPTQKKVALLKSFVEFRICENVALGYWKEMKELWFEVVDALQLTDQHELSEWFNEQDIADSCRVERHVNLKFIASIQWL